MSKRELDWKEFINRLVYCFGCGRFGKPSPKGIPSGWKVLYNPHAEGKPGLHVCGDGCKAKVLAALREGPVLEPLEMGPPPPMPVEMKESALEGAISSRVRERVETVLDDQKTVEAVTSAVTDALIEKNYAADSIDLRLRVIDVDEPSKPMFGGREVDIPKPVVIETKVVDGADVIPFKRKGQTVCPSGDNDDD